MAPNHCPICKLNPPDKYCAKCGQLIEVKKTSLISIIKDFADHVFSVQKSILLSLLTFLKNPFFWSMPTY